MVPAARIRTSRWAAASCALAIAAGGCALDSRRLTAHEADVRTEPDRGDGDAAAWLDAPLVRLARPRAPGQRAPSGFAGSASTPYAPAADRDAAPDDSGMASPSPSPSQSDSGTASPEAGADPGPTVPDCHRLVVSSAWIDDFSNCLEIQGEPFASLGEGGNPHSLHIASEPICMREASATAAGPTTLGFFLNQSSPGAAPIDYDARIHGVTGFRFRVTEYLSGDPLPFVGVESQGQIYCMPTSGLGAYEVHLRDLRVRCWESSSGPAPDPEHVRSLLFYYPPSWPGEPIGMCISDLFAIVEPG